MARIGVSRAAWIVLAIAFAAAAGGVGFLAGRSQQIEAMIESLQVEAAGNLTQRVEVLSLLRTGDVSGAITRLESEADLLTVNIAGIAARTSPEARTISAKSRTNARRDFPVDRGALELTCTAIDAFRAGKYINSV
jgi:hypothetical protein